MPNTLLPYRAPALGLIAALGLATLLISPRPAPAKKEGGLSVKKIAYGGWKNNLLISNGDAELIVTLDVGPRVISYKLTGGKNVFKEFADQMGKTGGKEWKSYGGHRLWIGPEDLTRTYYGDNGRVKYKEIDGGIRFTPGPETEYGMQKEIDIKLAPSGSKVTLVHRISNFGNKETELAPWALTVMAPGGIEVIPLPPHHPHPGPPQNAKSPKDYAASFNMSVWPFTDFKDPRWNFGTNYITLQQQPNKGPTKIGLGHDQGWVGYLNGGTLFVKRFDLQEGKTYPDRGCNFETFTNEEMLEMETLGPVQKLGSKAAVEHTEAWELYKDVPAFKSEKEIDKEITGRVKK
ncbi:MAG: hypothetical protein ACJ8FY_13640 [Gemmataceae bacterium]